MDQFYLVDVGLVGSERVVLETSLFNNLQRVQPRWLVYWPESFALAPLLQFDPPKRSLEEFGDWRFRLRWYQDREEEIGPVAIYEIF